MMTSCLAVSERAVAVSSVDADVCFACSLDDAAAAAKNLTERLGETYGRMPVNGGGGDDLRKACAAFSSDGELFAYNTARGKLLSVWNTAGGWSLLENVALAKNATHVVFTPRTRAIVVADKKGDVYAYRERQRPAVRVLGHSAMVLDVCFTEDERYVVTCDSDEKVRVSRYPNGNNIVHYLMGHEAYVCGAVWCGPSDAAVLSGSGDRTLRLWDLRGGGGGGRLLDKLDVRSPVRSVVKLAGDVAAVHLYDSNRVHVVKTAVGGVEIVKTVEFDSNVANVAAHGGRLWIVAGDSVYNYRVDWACDEVVVRNEHDERLSATLNELVKSFVRSERANLFVYLHKKMMDKRARIELYGGESSAAPPDAKRIKQNVDVSV